MPWLMNSPTLTELTVFTLASFRVRYAVTAYRLSAWLYEWLYGTVHLERTPD
jgi:hypothetical protein